LGVGVEGAEVFEEGEGELGVAVGDGGDDGGGGEIGGVEETRAGGFGQLVLPGFIDGGESGVGFEPAPECDAGNAGPCGGVGEGAAVGEGGDGELLVDGEGFEGEILELRGEGGGHGGVSFRGGV